jgi:hypothetical protein
VATALGRIFIREIARAQQRRADLSEAQHGALNFIQRFGGSLNLHFHAVVLDGVFAPNSQGRQAFHETGAPSREQLDEIVKRIRRRALRWVRTRGLFDQRAAEERSNEAPERSALDACAEVALRGGEFVRIEEGAVMRADGGGEARFEPKRRGPFMAELDGFNIQAAVRIESYDDEGASDSCGIALVPASHWSGSVSSAMVE